MRASWNTTACTQWRKNMSHPGALWVSYSELFFDGINIPVGKASVGLWSFLHAVVIFLASDHICSLLTGDERQRQGVRVIMASFYWLVRAKRNSPQAAAELKSSSRGDDHWSFEPVDLFQIPWQTLLPLVNVWAARVRNWEVCIGRVIYMESSGENMEKYGEEPTVIEGWECETKMINEEKGEPTSKVLQGRH